MTKVTYKNSSPYAKTPQTNWYLGPLAYRAIERDGTDTYRVLEAKYELRPDLLSYDLYGTPNWWWVFMIVNPDALKDPIYDFKAGLGLYLPQASRLNTILGA